LDDVADYLEIETKNRFNENVRAKYTIGIDYVIIRKKEKRVKDVKDAVYYVSFDTFEKICMSTHAKKGNDVQDYFILLRKFIDYYKQNISDMLLERITNDDFKHMYILLVDKGKNIFKTGRASNIRKRLKSYATGKSTHPDIKFIMLVNDPITVENCAKLFLQEYQYRGNTELYKVNIDLIKRVLFNCALTKKDTTDFDIHTDSTVDAYVIYDEDAIEYLDVDNNVIGYEENIEKRKNKNKSKSKSKNKSKSKKVMKG
jgi:phage anti-repressor protein